MPLLTSRPSSTLTHISIVGAGAIGQLIFHQLSTAINPLQHRLNIITRASQSCTQQLTLTDLNHRQTTKMAMLVGKDEYAQQLPNTDLLIVCVKAYQVNNALQSLLPHLSPNCHILLLHNGMGPHLTVSAMLAGQSLSLGTTSQGALKQSAWHITQTGNGLTQLGPYSQPSTLPQPLQTMLLTAIPNSQWCSDILTMLWQKLAVNAAINPLTAIEQCQNGQLADKQYQADITTVVAELVSVAKAQHIELELNAVLDRVYQVIALTAQNYSSMHQDVHHQRLTEIDAINGFVVQMAKNHHIATPKNQLFVEQIKLLEQQYSPLISS
ncbi:ketopantoate reductase family protein [Shewanella youngdeokensis]|uniref:2-dehydropantoate 2-reductase n=1 Tax=Shewanella youngdeokensis TaxID=2999068 RepID=A0ABZ0K076_9GAMM|nr:2-dehydropantoate 2-reductase [Shewanella sp. DAU334]